MKILEGKVALITGATQGIGAGIARAFGAAGASVVVNYATNGEAAHNVVESIFRRGGRAFAIQADISKADEVSALFDEIDDAFGSPDILVNNTDVFACGLMDSVSQEDLSWPCSTNVFGTLHAIQEAVKRFGPNGGAIINIGAIDSQNTAPNMVVYSATKTAIDTLTLALSHELGPRRIRVNAIAPDLADLNMRLSQDMAQYAGATTSSGCRLESDNVAKIAVFLASDAAAFVTGERMTAPGRWQ